jgi:hypothetical protein
MNSRTVLTDLQAGHFQIYEDNPHYKIYRPTIKEYPAATLLVQSSGGVINLGQDMVPFLDTEKLHNFVAEQQVPRVADSPQEIYLYHWQGKAQGPLIFDVGIQVEDGYEIPDGDHGFVIRTLPAMRVSSMLYQGPFPYQEMSGWSRIDWEGQTRDLGLTYKETLYRELYHLYDWDSSQHVTEIELEVETEG